MERLTKPHLDELLSAFLANKITHLKRKHLMYSLKKSEVSD